MYLVNYAERREAGAIQIIPSSSRINPGSEDKARFAIVVPKWDPNTGEEVDPEIGTITLASVRGDLEKWRKMIADLEALEADLLAQIEQVKESKQER
jgi:hypothetical protein